MGKYIFIYASTEMSFKNIKHYVNGNILGNDLRGDVVRDLKHKLGYTLSLCIFKSLLWDTNYFYCVQCIWTKQ